MNVCIPISEDQGLASPVCAHFGSAPAFLVVDTERGSHRVIANANAQHEHGHCAPVFLLAGQHIDAFIVGGIGPGALTNLLSTGASVYRGGAGSAAGALEALSRGALPGVGTADTCGHHHR